MAITINHNINIGNIPDFSQIFESFIAKFEAISQNVSNPSQVMHNTQSQATSETKDNFKSFDALTASNNQLSSSIKNNLSNLFIANTKKAEELTTAFNSSINEYKTQKIISQELNKSLQDLNKQLKPASQGGFSSNLFKGLMGLEWLEGLNKISHTAAERGAIVGGQQQSLNTNIMSATDFTQKYQSQLMQNNQQMANTAASTILTMVGGAIGGAIGSVVPGAGTLVGAGIGAGLGSAGADAINYFGNKNTAQNIATNQFKLQQDENAWRMRNMLGLGATGATSSLEGTSYRAHLNDIQSSMMADPKMAAYANNLPSYMQSANRQQMYGELGNTKNNVKNMTTAGQLMGVPEQQMPQFINAVTTTAMATGQHTTDLLKQLVDTNAKYGGDTVKNTALTLQLMQTSHVGNYQQAADLVNRYQYNQPALQNVTNFANADPMSKWVATQLMKAGGFSEKEATNVELNAADMAKYRQGQKAGGSPDPVDLLANKAYGIVGKDINVSPIGIMAKNLTAKASIESAQTQPPAAMQQFTDMVLNSLKNLNINNQEVYAKVVNITGAQFNSPSNKNENGTVNQTDKLTRSQVTRSKGSNTGNYSVPPIILQ